MATLALKLPVSRNLSLTASARASLSSEVCLSEVAEDPHKRDKMMVFAAIVDIAEPVYHKEKEMYVTRMKIIDPSFNFKSYVANKEIRFHKYAKCIVYSKTLAKCPKVKKVGDIIRLRRFNFAVSEKGELIGFDNMYSNWLIYKGERGATDVSSSFHDIAKNLQRSLTPLEKNRLEEMRNWVSTFFSQNRLKFVSWWTDISEPSQEELDSKKYTAVSVDLILKTDKVSDERKAIGFVDEHGRRYYLLLNAPPVIRVGDVIKLRCVNVIFGKDGRVIQLTKDSSCLLVPDNFYDALLFNQQAQVTPAPSGFPSVLRSLPSSAQRAPGTPLATKRQALAMFPFLNEYPFEEYLVTNALNSTSASKKTPLFVEHPTLIKKQYIHKLPTDISTLLEALKEPQGHEGERFVIHGSIVDTNETNLSKIVKRMNNKTKKTFGWREPIPIEETNDLSYIYHFILHLKDKSVEKSDKILSAYVLTNEGDQHMFDLWELLPRADDNPAWETLEDNQIAKFEKRFKLLRQSASKNVKIVVELLVTSTGKPFFKVFDTIFLP